MDTIRNISIILLCTVSVVNGENSRNCPKNAVVVEGNETISNCTFHPFNLTVFWKFKGIKQTQEESIYNGYRVLQNFTNRVSIMRPHNHSYDLKINDTRLDNAGTYICERGMGNPCSAELVVIAYHPNCSWNSTLSSEADLEIHVQCHVEYRGNMEATMQLEHDDALQDGKKTSNNPHTWSWILKMERNREDIHQIKCRLIFSSTIYSLDRSNNTAFVNWTFSIPLDQHIWSKDTTVKKAADKTKRNADDDTTAVTTTTSPLKNSFMGGVERIVVYSLLFLLLLLCLVLSVCTGALYVKYNKLKSTSERGNSAIIAVEGASPSPSSPHPSNQHSLAEEIHLQDCSREYANAKIRKQEKYVNVPAELPAEPACYAGLESLEEDRLKSVYTKLAKVDVGERKHVCFKCCF